MLETTIDETPREKPRRADPCYRVLCEAGVVAAAPDVVLGAGTLVLGRHESCDIVLGDPRVSRRHALLHVTAGSVTLEDQSKSGTYVSDRRVTRHDLRAGEVIVLGQSALVVHPAGCTESPEPIEGLVGEAPSMRRVNRTLRRVATSDMGVLMLGETGTGKDAVARALHRLSGRSGDYVPVNCGALPTNLVESQLFGHVAGAFTGGDRAALGLFRAADAGTLFLDELGELQLDVQPKLLRALESHEVRPVGATAPSSFDARVVAATNRDLLDDVASGRFRADLYARISDFVLELPPLRDRIEDVLLLLATMYGDEMPPISSRLLRALLGHAWPFNVREVGKIAGRLRLEGGAERLELDSVEQDLAHSRRLAGRLVAQRATVDTAVAPPDKAMLEELLRDKRGVVSEVAKSVGRSRKQVYRWLTKHGVKPEDYRED